MSGHRVMGELGELPMDTWTPGQLAAARARPPLTADDLPKFHRRNYKAAGSKPYKERPRRVTRHGTVSGASKGCKCEACREARRIYDRQRAPLRKAKRAAARAAA